MPQAKKVYVSLIADLLHAGHIRVLKEAEKYGKVTVGLLTQAAIHEMNDMAYLRYKQREVVVQSLSMVETVVRQETASYRENLLKLKPDYVVHGDDWVDSSSHGHYREEVIRVLNGWGGKLIEVPYSSDITDQKYQKSIDEIRCYKDQSITAIEIFNKI